MTVRDKLEGGAKQRLHVDAAVLAKPPVLIGDQSFHEERIDIGELHRQPPATVGYRERPQQHAVSVDDNAPGLRRERGKLHIRDGVFQRQWSRRRDEARGDEGGGEQRPNGETAPLPALPRQGEGRARTARSGGACSAYLSGPTTSTLPLSVLARRSGRYMSSISAAGCKKVPGETARTM